jgi:hypothetical protein
MFGRVFTESLIFFSLLSEMGEIEWIEGLPSLNNLSHLHFSINFCLNNTPLKTVISSEKIICNNDYFHSNISWFFENF